MYLIVHTCLYKLPTPPPAPPAPLFCEINKVFGKMWPYLSAYVPFDHIAKGGCYKWRCGSHTISNIEDINQQIASR